MRLHRLTLTILAAAGISAGLTQFVWAADMALKAPRAPTFIYNWSGFYIGANGGYGWGRSDWTDDPSLGASLLGAHTTKGGFVGGQVGYNWQHGIAVFGVEADIDWADLKGNHVDQFAHDLNSKVTSLGTITGRAGFAYWDRVLIYAKAGAGWGRFTYDDFVTLGGPLSGSASGSRWGWVVGAGLEYGFAPGWSAKVEYNYFDFNAKRMAFSGGAAGAYVQDIDENLHLIKGGINYRFGR